MRRLIEDGVVVELDDIGEGYSGEYDPEDPDDEPLLRFFVSLETLDESDPDYPEDASYCTRLPVSLESSAQDVALRAIMDAVKDAVRQRISIKRTCENLSWLSPEDLEVVMSS